MFILKLKNSCRINNTLHAILDFCVYLNMCQKGLHSAVFILLILFSTLKINAQLHYCHGQLSEISFEQIKGCCPEDQKDCCDDDAFEIENDQDLQQQEEQLQSFNIDILDHEAQPFCFTEELLSVQFFNIFSNKAPPLISKQNIYLIQQKLILYHNS